MIASRSWQARCVWILLGGLVFLCAPTSVSANSTSGHLGLVVHGDGAGAQRVAGALEELLVQKLRQTKSYETLSTIGERLQQENRDAAQKSIQEGWDLLAKGREAYFNLALGEAIKSLASALDKLSAQSAFIDNLDPLVEAFMLQGASAILLGRTKSAKNKLERALVLSPDVSPDPKIFNDSMRQVFKTVVKRLKDKSKGAISIDSIPGYAKAYLDGRFVGVTPVAVDDIIEGKHYLSLTKAGYGSWGKMTEVKGQRERSVTARLKPSPSLDQYESILETSFAQQKQLVKTMSTSEPKEMRKLAKLFKSIDELLMVSVRLDGDVVSMDGVLYSLTSPASPKVIQWNFRYQAAASKYQGEVEKFADSLLSKRQEAQKDIRSGGGLSQDADKSGGVNSPATACGTMECDTYKMVLSGSIGLGGFLVMAGGGVLWGLATNRHNVLTGGSLAALTTVVDPIRNQGHAFTLAGDVVFGVGALAFLAGGALYLFWDPGASTAGQANSNLAMNVDWSHLPGGGIFSFEMGF
jgi:hypothetical protein